MRRLLSTLVLTLFTLTAHAQSFPEAQGYVNDFAHQLSNSDRARLEALGREIQQKADLEIAFVTMDSIPDGEDISLYAVELAHHWGVGGKGTDRGALLLYKSGRDGSGRQVYLATGYGIEGDIPDAAAGRILDQVTIPYLREGRVFEGFAGTALAVVDRVAPDVQLTGAVPRDIQWRSRSDDEVSPFGLIVMIIIVAILMSSRTGRGFLFGMVLSSMFGRRGGGWGGGGFGGGGFGGGFGGFGGGGFGGGGAGRSF